MENIVFNMAAMHRHGSAFYDFLRLRKEFFVDQLGWDIPHDGEVEMDQYDNPTAWYSLVVRDGEVVGGGRAMPTTAQWGEHTYMIGDVASGRVTSIPLAIVAGSIVTPQAWECTRVVISDSLITQAERALCLSMLAEGILSVAARHGAVEIMCLSRVTLMRALRQLGFPCDRKGESYVEPADGHRYAMLSMPVRSGHAAVAGRVAASGPGRPPAGRPTLAQLSQSLLVHAPSVA